jgi:hypothetical protein
MNPKLDEYCIDCTHRKDCEQEYGEIREGGDDFRAVVGSHFCRKSWDQFYYDMKRKRK